jgi:prophage regulatory protein
MVQHLYISGEAIMQFIKLEEVKNLCGLSRSSIYRGMNEGTFPKRIKVSKRSVVWSKESIYKWINQHIQEQLQ